MKNNRHKALAETPACTDFIKGGEAPQKFTVIPKGITVIQILEADIATEGYLYEFYGYNGGPFYFILINLNGDEKVLMTNKYTHYWITDDFKSDPFEISYQVVDYNDFNDIILEHIFN